MTGPAAAPGRDRRRVGPTGWSLRTQLVGTLVVLLAEIGIVVGVATVAALRGFLFHQLDSQLGAAVGRSATAFRHPPSGDGRGTGGPRFLVAPGQGAGTLGARIVNGSVRQAALLGEDGGFRPVPAVARSALTRIPVDGKAHTRDLGSAGSYRLIAVRTHDGSTLVTGLPLRGLTATLYRLGVVIAAVTVIALIIAAVAGFLIVRLALRPLQRVTQTAGRVTELDLDRGEVDQLGRVPEEIAGRRTEVGQVGATLNRLLDHVGAALAARQASETRVR